MLEDRKILVTGVGGVAALPIATWLAERNEVWGLSRFPDRSEGAAPALAGRNKGAVASRSVSRQEVESRGIRTFAADLADGDLSGLPDDFTHVLHFAWMRGDAASLDQALRVNGVGTGRILHHCRGARGALVISSAAVYTHHPDPWHLYREDDLIGRAATEFVPTSSACKVSEEAVARFCAETFDLPVTIARLNTVYGPAGGLPTRDRDLILAGRGVVTPHDPTPHSPIHAHDMRDQVAALLDAAHRRPTIVNWAGDEVVTAQHWWALTETLSGRKAEGRVEGDGGKGNAADVTRRKSITGPCRTTFDAGFTALYRERYPT